MGRKQRGVTAVQPSLKQIAEKTAKEAPKAVPVVVADPYAGLSDKAKELAVAFDKLSEEDQVNLLSWFDAAE
jgi:hypothetical protein